MKRQNDGTPSRDIFLFVLEQGWVGCPAVARAVGMDASFAGAYLRKMVATGTVRRRERDGAPEYAVTVDCKVPRSVTIKELQEAGVRLVEEGETC